MDGPQNPTSPLAATSPPAAEGHKSLEGMHGSIDVPKHTAGFWRQYRAFAGPALLVSVGYMDPGNWATDLQGGANFKFGLLWVVALSSLMAIVLQVCRARLGVVAGKDLATALPRPSSRSRSWPATWRRSWAAPSPSSSSSTSR